MTTLTALLDCLAVFIYKPERSLFWLTLSEHELGSSSRTEISSIPMRHSPPMESHCHQSCLHCNVSSLPVAQVLHKCHPAITWSQLCQIKHIFVSTFLCVSVHGCMHVHVYMAINSLILSIGPNHNLYWSHMIFTVPQT